ncbi:MAG TPA: proline dehydrogenase family protein [Bellilinea sp.]|nr:proline dehydrogenase family protein [Bellilinea sp.]
MASRFIAGDTIDDAIRVLEQLKVLGIRATLDLLGENTESQAEAAQSTADILAALNALNTFSLPANVSIKLSQLGLLLDAELAYANLVTILEWAKNLGNFVRVDMEDSSLTEITLNLVQRAQSAGYTNVGMVIQSYLYRSREDTSRLAQEGIRVRVVKGAYQEPASVAFPKKGDVDDAFDQLVKILLKAEKDLGQPGGSEDGRFPPLTAVGSHDPGRIKNAQDQMLKMGLPKRSIEFQFLYGIRRDLQQSLVKEGFPVRVYVPYGTHWYPYFMRRLAERPANIWFFISSFFQK